MFTGQHDHPCYSFFTSTTSRFYLTGFFCPELLWFVLGPRKCNQSIWICTTTSAW